MIARVAAGAGAEFRIVTRNRWVAVATALITLLALVLALVGSAPVGTVQADRLAVSIAGLTTLGVYLVPLLALLLSFDAVAGEVERGTLPLVATYPVRRTEFLAGKFAAHSAALALAICVGFGAAGVLAVVRDSGAVASLPGLFRLGVTAILLGAAFLGLGYATSCLARGTAGAAGYAVAMWLGMVVLYDAALLGAIVADDGGTFTRLVLPWLLALNPADAFRLLNLADGPAAVISGLAEVGDAVPRMAARAALLLWPVLAVALAAGTLSRREL